jgi:hypothetical protein
VGAGAYTILNIGELQMLDVNNITLMVTTEDRILVKIKNLEGFIVFYGKDRLKQLMIYLKGLNE